MNEIVLNGLDDELAAEIRSVSERDHISMEHAAMKLIRNGVQSEVKETPSDKIGNSLDEFIGTMSESEADKIDEAIRELRTVDESVWR